MPRLTLDPLTPEVIADWDKWKIAGATDTVIDMCDNCADQFDGFKVTVHGDGRILVTMPMIVAEPAGTYKLVAGAEHPPYENENYFCCVCFLPLDEEDN